LLAVATIACALTGLVFTGNLIDFPVYYAAGGSLTGGRADLYASDFARGPLMDYRYPPFFLLIFYPLWLLPYPAAAYIWYLLSVIEIIGCVFFLRNSLGPTSIPRPVWVISFFCVGQYFVMILHYGNAHLLAVFLLFGCFYYALRRKDFKPALLNSLSITIKLTPALILPYFLIKRRWKYLFAVAVLLFVINIMPAIYFGFSQNAGLLRSWYSHVIADQEFHEVNGPINLSLKGQLRRYLSDVDYSRRVDGDISYPAVNVASLAAGQVDTIWIIIASIFFLSAMVLIRHRSDPDSGRELLCLELGLMVCLMLFVGPLTSKIYFIALLWPVATLGYFAFGHKSASARFARAVLLFVAVINLALPLLPGRSTQRLLLALGVDFYLNFLVLLALGFALVSSRRQVLQSADVPQKSAQSETRTS
jgi:glycosyl transferase family 87